MLTESETHLYLSNFVPLIQIWAGICLLFFYEKLLLSNNPLEKSRQKCVEKIYEAYNLMRRRAIGKYQSYFINNDTGDMEIPQELPSPLNTNQERMPDKYWLRFRKYIYNTAIVSFFYAIIVMFIAGVERYDYLVNNNFYKVLLITNSMLILHFIIASITYKRNFSQRILPHVCFLLSVMIYIHIHMQLRDIVYTKLGVSPWCSVGNGPVVIFTLASCLSGLALIIVNILFARFHTWQEEYAVNKLDKRFARLQLLPVSWKAFRKYHPFVFLSIINKISKNISKLNNNEGRTKIFVNRIIAFVLLLVFCNDSADDSGNENMRNQNFGSFHNSVYKLIDKMTIREMRSSMDNLRKAYYRFVYIEEKEET